MTRLTYHPLRVSRIVEETPDARTIEFEIPKELRRAFLYKPGQHLQLHVPCGAKPLPRCYSLSGTLTIAGDPWRVTVKRVAGGRASNWLCDHLKVGDTLEVAPPAGMFTAKSFDRDFLLYAGGSGITPVFSILRSVLVASKSRVRLVYANRDERSVIFGGQLQELVRKYPGRLEVIHWLDAEKGFATPPQLAELARGFEHAQCYICGPGPFMDAATAALKGIGVPHANVHVEIFVSLPEDADEEMAPSAPAPGDVTAEIEATLDGVTTKTSCPAGTLLIEALEAAGMAPPFSCRSGACAACMCKLDEGEVELVHNHVLAQSDLDQGWILCCQAVPKSAKIKISYPS